MSFETAVSIQNVSKTYHIYKSPVHRLMNVLFGAQLREPTHIYALADVSLDIKKGETLAVIGRNGSGKSTLLQVLCGILEPTAGSVQIKGRIAALLELGAGFSMDFTGRENIYMSCAVYGLSKASIDERLDSILRFAEIGDFIDQPVKTYSSGMFVRLAFAVIAHLDADILVIDEALAVGDAYFTQKCMRFLRDFKARGTLIFVSHDTHSVISLCDRALWLEKGRMKLLGDAKPVSEAYISLLHQERDADCHDSTVESKGEHAITAQGEFGTGEAHILSCRLLSESGSELMLLDRAQQVTLEVKCTAFKDIQRPILGFFVRDRLGQPLFGENSLEFAKNWAFIKAEQTQVLRFTFAMPLLATGEYTVGVALGSGTQDTHVQHHWIYDAYAFKSQASPHLTGTIVLDDVAFIAEAEGMQVVAQGGAEIAPRG